MDLSSLRQSQSEQASQISCTFVGCKAKFPTDKAMRKHKSTAPEHDYCARCDVDFADEKGLFEHKKKSTRHIVCGACGEEFKSEGGRDAHIEQAHPPEQEIVCHGCKEKFTRAAALVAHLEGEHCSEIPKDKFKKERVEKRVRNYNFNRGLDLAGKNPHDNVVGATGATDGSAESDGEGGVGINLLDDEDEDEDDDRFIEDGQERSIEFEKANDEKSLSGRDEKGKDKENHPPPNNNGNDTNDDEEQGQAEETDLMNFSDTQSVSPRNRDSSDTYAADWGKWVKYRDQPSDSPIAQETGLVWDSDQFYNAMLGAYICECDATFNTAKELESHIHSGVHAGGVVRCPGCLRLFKSYVALVAHVESATRRCRISKSSNFGQVMDDLSGGVVEAVGYHEHGNSVILGGANAAMNSMKSRAVDPDQVDW